MAMTPEVTLLLAPYAISMYAELFSLQGALSFSQ